jgi:voltage-gated potassium channel
MLSHLKQRVNDILDVSGEVRRPTGMIDYALLALILLNVVSVILETVEDWGETYGEAFFLFEIASVIIFTVEYLLRVWSCTQASSRRFRHPILGRLRYMATPLALIDLLAILPFYLSFAIGVDLRFLRVIRLLRILKITRYSVAFETFLAVLRAQKGPLISAGLLMSIVLIIAAAMMYMVERTAQPEAFASIPHAMWWALVTLTTVGYGDITPITGAGRVVGGVVTVLGLLMYALPAGIIASGFMQELRKREFVVTWTMVAKVPIFSRLDADKIAAISNLLAPKIVPADFTIFRAGDQPDGMHFIIEGEVEIELTPTPIRLRDGEYYGEIAIIKDVPRRVTVTAVTECRLLILGVREFRNLLDEHPDLREEFTRVAEERLSGVNGEST